MTPSTQRVKRRSILIVDDDPISRELVALLLGAEGHVVTKAASGNEAIRALKAAEKNQRPSAILVDLQMPGVSGDTLAERLRNQVGEGVPILAMSATEPATHGQFDGFLRKPIDTNVLASLLGSAVPHAQAARARNKTTDDSNVLNEAMFQKLKTMMSEHALDEVFTVCIWDVRKRIPEMTRWLYEGEMKSLRVCAHTIKGGSSMLGATSIAAIAQRLELGSYKRGEGLKILEELASACSELERILQERKAGRLW
jgi:CheY-like chemotaxis protein